MLTCIEVRSLFVVNIVLVGVLICALVLVAIDKRVYQMNGDDALFVGIPDVTVERKRTATNQSQFNVAVATPSSTPVTVTVS